MPIGRHVALLRTRHERRPLVLGTMSLCVVHAHSLRRMRPQRGSGPRLRQTRFHKLSASPSNLGPAATNFESEGCGPDEPDFLQDTPPPYLKENIPCPLRQRPLSSPLLPPRRWRFCQSSPRLRRLLRLNPPINSSAASASMPRARTIAAPAACMPAPENPKPPTTQSRGFTCRPAP